MAPRSGFTLLEVLLALLLVTLGVLGFLATLGPITALAADGRARGRIAGVLESRLDRLRVELGSAAPACAPPPAGTQSHPDGTVESWRATAQGGLVGLEVAAWTLGKPSRVDSLRTQVPCP